MENEKRVYCEILGDITDLMNGLNKDLNLKSLLVELKEGFKIELSTEFLKSLIEDKNDKQKSLMLYKLLRKQEFKPSVEKVKSINEIVFSLDRVEITDYTRNERGNIEILDIHNEDILKSNRFNRIKTYNLFDL